MKSEKNIIVDDVSKKFLSGEGENTIYLSYTDVISISKKRSTIDGIGEKLKVINSFFLDYLNAYNILTGYKGNSEKGITYEKHSRYPFSVRIQNVVDKDSSKMFSAEEGLHLQTPLISVLFNSLYPISDSHILAFNICPLEEIKIIRRICSKINVVLKSYFERRNLILSEVSCYFAVEENKIFVVDDFTPVSIKLKTEQKGLFKDPYKIKTAGDFEAYTDFFINLIKS